MRACGVPGRGGGLCVGVRSGEEGVCEREEIMVCWIILDPL